MKLTTRFASSRMLLAIGAILAGCLLALPMQLPATNTCSGLVAQVRVRSVDANLGYLSLHTASRRASIFSCHTAFAAFSSPDSHTS